MLSKVWLINVVLVILMAFFGLKAYGVWFQENKGTEIPEMAKKPAQRITKSLVYERKIPPESEYDALMVLNLFSPKRTEIMPDEAKPDEKVEKLSSVEQKKIQEKFSKLTLYGLVITNDFAEALVSYLAIKPVLNSEPKPVFKRGRARAARNKNITVKQTKWVKVGDTLGDFKVMAIKPDRVLLKGGDQSYDLLLYDKDHIKNRGPAKPRIGPTVVGVSVNPPFTNVEGKKPTIPLTVKKVTTAAKVGIGAAPPATRKTVKTDIKKKNAR